MEIRQGDVLLRKINTLPKGLKEKNKILAYGEITGHHHRFRENLQCVSVFADEQGKQFCDVKSEAVLEHEDHAHLKVPEGKYEVIIQREFDLIEGVRSVCD